MYDNAQAGKKNKVLQGCAKTKKPTANGWLL
jgi:hypothetical protein